MDEIEVRTEHKPYGLYEKYFKRLLDLFCGILVVIVFWWIYIIIAILVRVKLGTPVFFIQNRPGKDEKIFKLYKFRTMTNEKNEMGELFPDEVRLTKFGKLLRSTSLDELPEVFNIIKGDMSFVGPRPLLEEYLPWYTKEEQCRHDVRPGLSGLAQVNGRNFLDWDHRLAFDIQYVQKITFCGDIKIVFQTIGKILQRQDIAVNTRTTESNFASERKARQKKLSEQ